jgi:hypothetical protein
MAERDPINSARHGRLGETADRFDELAETAELMGDADGAQQLRERALALLMEAMRLLDD